MQFNVDKRFIEILNQSGAKVTWEQFRKANDLRRSERDNDPVAVAKKEKARLRDMADLEALTAFHKQLELARNGIGVSGS
jgi:hypothetical protein